MNQLDIHIDCIPMAVQSFRMSVIAGHAHKYQPKKVYEYKAMVRELAIQQLPKDFAPFKCPVFLRCVYAFPIPKSMPKRRVRDIEAGIPVFKDTRPDLDNCGKATRDALTGVVWTDDSIVTMDFATKVYRAVPGIDISVMPITDDALQEFYSIVGFSKEEPTQETQEDERQLQLPF